MIKFKNILTEGLTFIDADNSGIKLFVDKKLVTKMLETDKAIGLIRISSDVFKWIPKFKVNWNIDDLKKFFKKTRSLKKVEYLGFLILKEKSNKGSLALNKKYEKDLKSSIPSWIKITKSYTSNEYKELEKTVSSWAK